MKDITGISVPFSAGVLFGAYLPLNFHSLIPATGITFILSVLLFCFFLRSDSCRLSCFAILSVLGALCSFNARMGAGLPPLDFPFAERALEKFCAAIDEIDFNDSRLNGLAKALLTGQRNELDEKMEEAFRISGAAHILALSGMHLALIYSLIRNCLFWMGHSPFAQTLRALLLVLSSGFYSIMTGANPSVVRAFFFIVFNETARLCPGRKAGTLSVFCSALMCQLLINPMVIKSIGFQLSYLSVLGIFTIFPKLKSWYPSEGRSFMRKIWNSAAMSISCQLSTAPLVYLRFKSFPVYFLLTNLLAIPLSSAFMIFVIISIVLKTRDPAETVGRALIDIIEIIASLT